MCYTTIRKKSEIFRLECTVDPQWRNGHSHLVPWVAYNMSEVSVNQTTRFLARSWRTTLWRKWILQMWENVPFGQRDEFILLLFNLFLCPLPLPKSDVHCELHRQCHRTSPIAFAMFVLYLEVFDLDYYSIVPLFDSPSHSSGLNLFQPPPSLTPMF